nr:hypothetical protein BaRGS_035060 [Batillaria attramentaria]
MGGLCVSRCRCTCRHHGAAADRNDVTSDKRPQSARPTSEPTSNHIPRPCDAYSAALLSRRHWCCSCGTEGLDRFVKTDPTVLAGDEGTHFNKVVGDKYVFIGMRDTIDLWLQRDCGLVRGEDPVRQLLVAPAFAKDSALTRYFSDV